MNKFAARQLAIAIISAVTSGSLYWALAERPPAQASDSVGLLTTNTNAVFGQLEQEAGKQRLRLSAPIADPTALPALMVGPEARSEGPLHALAYQYDSRIYQAPAKRPTAVGIVRRGTRLSARGRVRGPGCRKGSWYRLLGSPFVICNRDGFVVSSKRRKPEVRQAQPDLKGTLPYRYGKTNDRSALRYFALPTLAEEEQAEAALAAGERLPKVADMQLDGDYLVAIDREVTQQEATGHPFLRTVRGRYIRADKMDAKPLPPLRGERLKRGLKRPLAFIFGEEPAPMLRKQGEDISEIGSAEEHARFQVKREEIWNGQAVVVSTEGYAVPRERVRIVRPIKRPSGVPKGAKFIHVNLSEQTLVAYRGARAVLATVISSGKEGHDTPAGLFRIREKHISTTMRGSDPGGVFEVEEVPWTMYYFNSFALHGAYWHNEFGNVRSHGCTNIAPADARFLFHWTTPKLPKGWHGRRKVKGTYVYLTRDTPAPPTENAH